MSQPFISPRFIKRLISALILGPIALVMLVGHPISFFMVVIPAFLLAVYEWVGFVRAVPRHKIFTACVGAIYIPACFGAFTALRLQFGAEPNIYTSDSFDALHFGPVFVLVLLIAVWASDTGAYIFGKTIGGPKWVPSISPNKTWAGLVGAIIFPIITLFPIMFLIGAGVQSYQAIYMMMGFVMVLGLVCQMGDLFVSVFKRRAGLKDTGALIPGHGGILDRIDSLMMAALFSYVILAVI